ncbi:MAG: hypothetical protein PHP31_04915 [Lentimicrobiaceae bacterium]|nr:hypothetical protein [Lentimicrobiaceae bacterium]
MNRFIVKYIFKPLWIVIKSVLLFILFLVVVAALVHLFVPRYDFPDKNKFEGNFLYNPYKNFKAENTIRGNFHMHSNAWGGFTNGSKNTDEAIFERYEYMGFSSLSISNYQTINEYKSDEESYIPNYEHGYSIFKNHHLNLGAKKVVWFDLPLYQTLSQKQYMIDLLKKHCDLLCVNHPAFFHGYRPKDFSYLTSYDFIEVLNGYENSISHWDSALSAGRPALLLANDDMHDVYNCYGVASRFNLVNTESNKREDVFKSLSEGNNIGVWVKNHDVESWEIRKARLDSMSMPSKITLVNDTFCVEMTKNVSRYDFFGQNGRLLKRVEGGKSAYYVVKPSDTYVRLVAYLKTEQFFDGIQLFFNPIMRSSDGDIPPMPKAVVNNAKTFIVRLIIVAAAIFAVAYTVTRRVNRRKRKV